MSNAGPIGIFDSGIGGLSIAKAIRQYLPTEDLLYVADTRYAPYGEKTDDAIYARMQAITEFLLSRQAKAIVVACNTATTAAIAKLRAHYPVPIIGVEPGIKPAVLATKTGVIGVLATPRTLQTHSFAQLAARFARNVKVELQPCPELVAQIEALNFSGDTMRLLLQSYLQPLIEKQVDTVVLGCTHYHHITAQIAELVDGKMHIITTEHAVAKEVARRLAADNLLAPSAESGNDTFYTSGDINRFTRQLDYLWGKNAKAAELESDVLSPS